MGHGRPSKGFKEKQTSAGFKEKLTKLVVGG